MTNNLTETVRELSKFRVMLAEHTKASDAETKRLLSEVRHYEDIVKMVEAGIDHEKISLARAVLSIYGLYKDGGTDRDTVIRDAVNQLATGIPAREHYSDLWIQRLGTKNYDGWRGQRSDHEYGYGPRHGSICFGVGIVDSVRKRDLRILTADETEAAIYMLLNLDRVQAVSILAAQVAS